MKLAHSIQKYLGVIRKGSRSEFKDGKPKKVTIVGAGVAGLVSGLCSMSCALSGVEVYLWM
jgi:NADPH-dependent 2,4-dienoyl-CoA reductase/sulfur reductase-like enzyme